MPETISFTCSAPRHAPGSDGWPLHNHDVDVPDKTMVLVTGDNSLWTPECSLWSKYGEQERSAWKIVATGTMGILRAHKELRKLANELQTAKPDLPWSTIGNLRSNAMQIPTQNPTAGESTKTFTCLGYRGRFHEVNEKDKSMSSDKCTGCAILEAIKELGF